MYIWAGQVWESAEALEVSRQQRQALAQRRTRSGSRSEPEPHAASTVVTVWLPLIGNVRVEYGCFLAYFLTASFPSKPTVKLKMSPVW